jgi:hypothetical protein
MTTVGNDFAIEGDEEKPRVVFVLTREEYEALRPCTPSKKSDWWADSPRLERTTDGRELLVYREGWEEQMAEHDAGALVWMGQKRLGGLDERTARELVTRVRSERQARPVVRERVVVEGDDLPFWMR